MYLENLIIETTRRCNMQCGHCLRGDVENVDFDPEYLRLFLTNNDIDSIGCLTYSGGEPSLAIGVISSCQEILEDLGIPYYSFYMATNGTNSSKEFINVLIDLYYGCDDYDSISAVDISNDQYHDKVDTKKLEVLKFVRNKYEKGRMSSVLAEGRGAGLYGSFVREPSDIYIENDTICGNVYLNARGYIISDCDFSYDTQEDYSLGHVKDTVLINVLTKEVA